MTNRTNDLSGTATLVTGGAKRIGREICLALADAHASVVVHYNRSEDPAFELVDELRRAGTTAQAVQADLADPTAVAELVARTCDAVGPLDMLVNNAAVFDPERLDDRSAAYLTENVQINAAAPARLSRDLAALGRSGAIVNLLDATCVTDVTGSAYHQSKHMLWADTLQLAVDLAPRIRVNGVAPGIILPARGQSTDQFHRLAACTPAGRPGTVDDVVDAVIFLLKNPFVTGQVLFIDGGWHLKKGRSPEPGTGNQED